MIIIDFPKNASQMLYPDASGTPFNRTVLKFEIAGVDLLGNYEIPALALARWGLRALQGAHKFGYASASFGVYDCEHVLLFKSEGQDVVLHSTFTEKTVQVTYVKLEQAWQAFNEDIRHFVVQHFPKWLADPREMRGVDGGPNWGPDWSDWLSGQVDTIDAYLDASRYHYNKHKEGLQHLDAIEGS